MELRFLVVSTLLLAHPSTLEARQDAPVRRWSVAGTVGWAVGGPATSAAGSMPSLGWGDTDPGLPIICIPYPDCPPRPRYYPETDGGHTTEIRIRYETSRRWALSVGATYDLNLGEVTGYRDSINGASGDQVRGRFRGSSHWIAAHLKPAERLSAGLGFSLLHVDNGYDYRVSESSSHRRVGITSEVALRVPGASRIFGELVVRGHWIPGDVRFMESSAQYDLPVALDVNLSYVTVTTGIGVRF